MRHIWSRGLREGSACYKLTTFCKKPAKPKDKNKKREKLIKRISIYIRILLEFSTTFTESSSFSQRAWLIQSVFSDGICEQRWNILCLVYSNFQSWFYKHIPRRSKNPEIGPEVFRKMARKSWFRTIGPFRFISVSGACVTGDHRVFRAYVNFGLWRGTAQIS